MEVSEIEKRYVSPEWFESVKCVGISAPDYAVPGSTVEIDVVLQGVAPLPFTKAEARAVLKDADTDKVIKVGETVYLANGEKHVWRFRIRMPNHDLRVYAVGQEYDWPWGWKTCCRTYVVTVKKVTPEQAAALKLTEVLLAAGIGAGIGYGVAAATNKPPLPFAVAGAACGLAVDLALRWKTLME